VATTIEACRLLGSAGLAAHLSIDPTAIGLLSDADACRRNAERIARSVAEQPLGRLNLVMLDMEDLTLVEPTLRLHRELLALGLPAASPCRRGCGGQPTISARSWASRPRCASSRVPSRSVPSTTPGRTRGQRGLSRPGHQDAGARGA